MTILGGNALEQIVDIVGLGSDRLNYNPALVSANFDCLFQPKMRGFQNSGGNSDGGALSPFLDYHCDALILYGRAYPRARPATPLL